jgi:hypothetical protein
MAQTEMAKLRFPATVIASEFVHEDDRCAAAGLLEKKAYSVIGSGLRIAV